MRDEALKQIKNEERLAIFSNLYNEHQPLGSFRYYCQSMGIPFELEKQEDNDLALQLASVTLKEQDKDLIKEKLATWQKIHIIECRIGRLQNEVLKL